ncbi:MAG: DUF4203 domain-containing protein [bacterium]|nr:DUF4203 domain-containing protein [bacterium]
MNNVGLSTLALILSILFGLVTCFFGYRIFRVLLVVAGFFIGASVGAALATAGSPLEAADPNPVIVILAFVVGGLVGAGLGYVLYPVGVVVAGAALGAALGSVTAGVLNAEQAVTLGFVIGGALVGGLVGLALSRVMIMLSTAFSGAGAFVSGIGTMLGIPALIGTTDRLYTYDLAGIVLVLVIAAVGFYYQYQEYQRTERRSPVMT